MKRNMETYAHGMNTFQLHKPTQYLKEKKIDIPCVKTVCVPASFMVELTQPYLIHHKIAQVRSKPQMMLHTLQ